MLMNFLFAGARSPRLPTKQRNRWLTHTRGNLHMKRIVIAGALALIAGGQALAADLPMARGPGPAVYAPIVPPVAFSWTGFYIGINGGGAFGNSNFLDPVLGNSGSFNASGGMVGGTIGANYQIGRWVLGIEGDGDWQNLDGTTFGGSCGGVGCETKSDWLATVRGRVGYTFDRVLVYGTGGAAFANVQANAGVLPFSSATETGWTAGGGVEYAFLPNWSAKLEYMYVGLPNASCGLANCGSSTTNVSVNENVIRGGVNFRFGGPGGFGW
jgi:outer membrane immunogenic protein